MKQATDIMATAVNVQEKTATSVMAATTTSQGAAPRGDIFDSQVYLVPTASRGGYTADHLAVQ